MRLASFEGCVFVQNKSFPIRENLCSGHRFFRIGRLVRLESLAHRIAIHEYRFAFSDLWHRVHTKKSRPFFQDFSRTKLNVQGPPTRNVISKMVYKCTFPVQANRFLMLQVFASFPSLHFSVHLCLFISCCYTRVLQCLKCLCTGKEY